MQRWLFFSSYTAIKTPNEKDYQRNELDEEFGVDLHYFDARMYDAQVGRFMGMDSKADMQFALSPFHQSANNPVSFRDPDGRLFFMAALVVGKLLLKKAVLKGTIAAIAKSKAVKIGVSATVNMVANRKQISKAFSGNFLKGIGTAFGYGAVGAAGGAVGLKANGLKTFVAGGLLNTGFEGATGQFSGDGVNGWGRALGSFLTGGSSAIAGKSFGKSMEKGSDLALNEMGFDLKGAAAGKGIFASKQLANYSLSGLANLGSKLNQYGGKLNIGQMGVFFGAGVASSMASYGLSKVGSEGIPKMFNRETSSLGYSLTSIASPFLSYATGDFAGNILNYYGAKGKFPTKLNQIYSDGFKSLFKVDFYTGSSFWGYQLTQGGYANIR